MTTTCEHKKYTTIVYGIYRCASCGTMRHENRVTSLTITPRVTLAHGDPCWIVGIGHATFYFVDEDRGGKFAHVKRAFGGTANVTTDRVRPAKRGFARRVEDAVA